ncbi:MULTISPECIES: hypothetical protein [Serratia]|jgi:hypothetical protein|uniref:hypothetical protein n=1 Tax=Serratia TaxID=613 RepID=UPI00384E3AC3
MSITSISVPKCECAFNSGDISFTSIIDYESPEDLETINIYYYFESPEDGREILFYEYISSRRATIPLIVIGDKNTEIINDLVKKHGNRAYKIIVKLADAGEAQKTVTEQYIQFSDVSTNINVESISSSIGVAEVKVSATYWNNECMELSLKTSIHPDPIKFSFDYDVNNYQWNGVITFSTQPGICNVPINLSLIGSYNESQSCPELPCKSWSYSNELSETVPGGCMNTNYPEGLHIFYDQSGDDRNCTVIKTALTGHLVASYTSIRTGKNRSVYLRVLSTRGILTQPILAPDVTDNEQRDADLAAIPGTDKFVAVWTSNAIGGAYRIYVRLFSVDANGNPRAEGPAKQLSNSNYNYLAPRIVYLKEMDKFFVTWIDIKDKQLQSIYLDNNDTLSEASYQGSMVGEIDSHYFVNTLDIHNSTTLSIARVAAGDKAIFAYKSATNHIKIIQFELNSGRPVGTVLYDYEVTGIQTFDLAYDDFNKKLKVVFHRTGSNDIYGDTLAYFGVSVSDAAPIRLNQQDRYACTRPFIKRTPKLANGERHFVVCWENKNYGDFYNFFNSEFSQLQPEKEINPGVSTTDSGRIVVTDNQLAIVVEATKFGSESLTGVGLLYYVAPRTDN